MNIEYVIRLPRDAGWEFDEFPWDSKEISKIIEIEKNAIQIKKKVKHITTPIPPI